MSLINPVRFAAFVLTAAVLAACDSSVTAPRDLSASYSGGSGGAGGGTIPKVDQIKVTKCYTNATATGFGEMLIKAASSDVSARLFAYRPDGSLIGEVQNGGGSRYGGTAMPIQMFDPVTVTIRSSSGGSIAVPTTPFQI